MSSPTRFQKLFVKMLKNVEEQSTCSRLKVGALLVRDNRVISMGWNGVPSGQKHCIEVFDEFHNDPVVRYQMIHDPKAFTENFNENHRIFSEMNEIHGESNAICTAAKNGISTNGATLYTSVAPCPSCAKMIIASGIKEVFYMKNYDRTNGGIELIQKTLGDVIHQLTEDKE